MANSAELQELIKLRAAAAAIEARLATQAIAAAEAETTEAAAPVVAKAKGQQAALPFKGPPPSAPAKGASAAGKSPALPPVSKQIAVPKKKPAEPVASGSKPAEPVASGSEPAKRALEAEAPAAIAGAAMKKQKLEPKEDVEAAKDEAQWASADWSDSKWSSSKSSDRSSTTGWEGSAATEKWDKQEAWGKSPKDKWHKSEDWGQKTDDWEESAWSKNKKGKGKGKGERPQMRKASMPAWQLEQEELKRHQPFKYCNACKSMSFNYKTAYLDSAGVCQSGWPPGLRPCSNVSCRLGRPLEEEMGKGKGKFVKVEPAEELVEPEPAEDAMEEDQEAEATRIANFQLINSKEVRQWRTNMLADMTRVAGNHESWLIVLDWINQAETEPSRAAVAAVCHEVNDHPDCPIVRAMLHAATVAVMEGMQGQKAEDDDLSSEVPEVKPE